MHQKLTCLVVDDDPGVRDLVAMNLAYEGLGVHLASSGHGIEALAESIKPDVILLDVMMPERDGYSVLSALKGTATTREIPVVLLSAKATDAEIWEGWKAGADYYLTKPFNVDELVSYLQLISEERRLAERRAPLAQPR